MRKVILLLLALLLLGGGDSIFCQVTKENYLKHVKEKASIYSGPTALEYNFLHDGTYYAYDTQFRKGDIYYNKKLYKDVLLNLNSHRDDLIIMYEGNAMGIVLDRECVDWFTMGERRFIKLEEGEYESLVDGYYEVLHDGKDIVLKRIVKKYQDNNANTIGLTRQFDNVSKRYFIREGKVYEISKAKALVKFYPEHKHAIKKFISAQSVEFRRKEYLDSSLAAVMDFIEKRK